MISSPKVPSQSPVSKMPNSHCLQAERLSNGKTCQSSRLRWQKHSRKVIPIRRPSNGTKEAIQRRRHFIQVASSTRAHGRKPCAQTRTIPQATSAMIYGITYHDCPGAVDKTRHWPKHPGRKLSDGEVRHMRAERREGRTLRYLSKLYGISPQCVNLCCKYESYQEVV